MTILKRRCPRSRPSEKDRFDPFRRARAEGAAMSRFLVAAVLALALVGAPQARADVIYWGDIGSFGPGAIERANLDGSGKVVLVSGLIEPTGIAVDVTGNKIYWADTYTGVIGRANLSDGSNPTVILSPLNNPIGVALDLSRGKIYWANSGNDTIGWANLSDNVPHTLFHTLVSNPSGVAVDVAGGQIYWTDYFGDIERGNLDGSGTPTVILSGLDPVGLGGPDGIALDLAGGKLYWANLGGFTIYSVGFIGRANLDGSGFTKLVDTPIPVGLALDLAHNKMYWGSINDLEVANLDGSGQTSFLTGLNRPTFPALPQAFPPADVSPSVPEPGSLALAGVAAAAGLCRYACRRWRRCGERKRGRNQSCSTRFLRQASSC
jgi:sugar lactone lactonase YvrE